MYMDKINIDIDSYQLNVEEHLRPSVERQLTGTTKLDSKIHSMPLPEKPYILKNSILLLRWYRKYLSPKLGNRCVFEPSCSHYSELAIRENGILKGYYQTIKRLYRCRPGNGGIDLPPTNGDINGIQN